MVITDSLQDKRRKANDMIDAMEEEDLNMALSYIRFLATSRKERELNDSSRKLENIQKMFADDKGGYLSEDDMIRDLAAFRRERMGL